MNLETFSEVSLSVLRAYTWSQGAVSLDRVPALQKQICLWIQDRLPAQLRASTCIVEQRCELALKLWVCYRAPATLCVDPAQQSPSLSVSFPRPLKVMPVGVL